METIFFQADFPSWRQVARDLLARGGHPEEVFWQARTAEGPYQGGLFDHLTAAEAVPSQRPQINQVPREFLDIAARVAYHRDARKWELMYRMLWRIVHENRQLLDIKVDRDVREFYGMEHSVRRDAHKMKAFVRFRKVTDPSGEDFYIAWHQPDHPLLRHVVPFFQDRFSVLNWTLLTPDESARWDGQRVEWGVGCPQSQAPNHDELEELWKCYYANIFNPARLKTKAMRAEMPRRYWKSMPETELIGQMIDDSEQRMEKMIKAVPPTAAPFLPSTQTRESLSQALQLCKACDLCHTATQAVFSEGPLTAQIMIIGEQPGDQEDRSGRPFVGPAGQLLDRALAEAGLQREELYLTNAVKHFKYRREGSRRIHQKPSGLEVAACKPWLAAELRLVRPEVIICLGLSSALAVCGMSLRMGEVRGRFMKTAAADRTLITYHPAHILRMSDAAEQAEAYRQLVEDLRLCLPAAIRLSQN